MASRHNKQIGDDIHGVLSYTYTNAAARLAASGFTDGDQGKIAKQSSDGTLWFLSSISPVTWLQVQTSVSADVSASYLVLNSSASLPNERILSVSGSSGLKAIDTGTNLNLSIDNGVVATLSGSIFTGPVSASAGLSGSLQCIAPNLPYLVGSNVTITTQSNGQIHISGSLFGSSFFQTSSNHPTQNVFNNSTTTLQSALRLTASNMMPGTYRVGWAFNWRCNSTANSFVAEFFIGSTSSWQFFEEVSEVAGNERHNTSYFTYVLITGSVQTFDIRARIEATATNTTASIYNREIEVWRIQ